MKIHTKEINDYQGLGRAIWLADNRYEMVVTLDIGPRIMSFSLLNGDSVFADSVKEKTLLPDGSEWRLYGGHRVWHSPEHFPRTYQSDSLPVEKFELTNEGIVVTQKSESWTQIQKFIQIEFKDGYVEINNKIKNCGAWPIETAVWAITVVPPGGYAVCPMGKKDTGLLPNAWFATWPYTKLNDDRITWGDKHIKVFADPKMEDELKIGYSNNAGWLAYYRENNIFIKQYHHQEKAKYPDFGCSTEVYTSYFGLEMETLSPFCTLDPDQVLQHTEHWHIHSAPENKSLDDIPLDERIIHTD